ncbi:helix-hairpin-helix domain-containing protein [Lacticaseibacillus jixianensis]|uniref:Helix-hairpin-helix domain-containing protein n=1 Tax=Lacticaseibacillus jixianensis TaxID=2486012 RepID=A0ABW4B7I0_9LACO|nr:helix-hairpin-helix domain-containing protein [Lacticaseibacillus jixianensis]
MASIKEWVREYWYLGLVAAAAGLFFLWQGRQPAPAIEELPLSSVSTSFSSAGAASTAQASSSTPKNGYVHIKGAVAKPGVYPVKAATRWVDVVALAGGLTPGADVSQVNLAQVAVDQESLYIPKAGETPPVSAPPQGPAGSTTGAAAAGSGPLVNLNTATASDLQTLSGIGPKKAADIIAYREQNGGFKSVEDLKNVSGIGDKTFEKLAPLVTIGP